MASVRKLTAEEVAALLSSRAPTVNAEIIRDEVRQVRELQPGDWLAIDLRPYEATNTIKGRYNRAARAEGIEIRWHRKIPHGPLLLEVIATRGG